MEEERKRMRFEILLSQYFSNYGKILTLNIIFLIPASLISGLLYFFSQLVFGGQNLFIMMLAVLFLYPFYSGIVLVTRNIARGDRSVKTCSLYFKTLKENLLVFFLHGVVLYIVSIVSYLAITFYITMAKSGSWFLYVILFFTFLIALLILFTFFYVPLMSVTYNLSVKNIYKNSFLMSFGEFKNNIFALLALIVVLAVYGTFIVICSFSRVLFMISIFAVAGLFIPSSASYVINFFIYEGMHSLISNKEERKQLLKEREENAKNPRKKAPEYSEEDFSGIDKSKLTDPDEYIYYNGKMVKQGVIMKWLEDKKTEENQNG